MNPIVKVITIDDGDTIKHRSMCNYCHKKLCKCLQRCTQCLQQDLITLPSVIRRDTQAVMW